jgi:hypothetical protein
MMSSADRAFGMLTDLLERNKPIVLRHVLVNVAVRLRQRRRQNANKAACAVRLPRLHGGVLAW